MSNGFLSRGFSKDSEISIHKYWNSLSFERLKKAVSLNKISILVSQNKKFVTKHIIYIYL